MRTVFSLLVLSKLLKISGHSINISNDPPNSQKDLTFTFSKMALNQYGKINITRMVALSYWDSKDLKATEYGKTYFCLMLCHQNNKLATLLAWESKFVVKLLKLTSGSITPHQQSSKSIEIGYWKEQILTILYLLILFSSTRKNDLKREKFCS